MKTLRSKLGGLVLGAIILSLLVSCGARGSHCYLCQGIPYEAPCLVDLSTGDVAPLTVNENDDAVSFQILGNAHIEQLPWETHATIPAELHPVNTALFCETCMELIEATPNCGYVLADLSDLSSITLYPIENSKVISIKGYDISAKADGNYIKIKAIISSRFHALKC